MRALDSVVIHPAYGWTCPNCQSVNFAFLATYTDPIPQPQPYPAGTIYYAGPDFVTCGTCKHEFAVPPTTTPANGLANTPANGAEIIPVPPSIIMEAPLAKTLEELAKAVALDRAAIEQDDKDMADVTARRSGHVDTLKADSDMLNRAVAFVQFYIVNPDGTATGFEPDGAGGVKPMTFQPGSTPVPDTTTPPAV
jgi:hypothetical protein